MINLPKLKEDIPQLDVATPLLDENFKDAQQISARNPIDNSVDSLDLSPEIALTYEERNPYLEYKDLMKDDLVQSIQHINFTDNDHKLSSPHAPYFSQQEP